MNYDKLSRWYDILSSGSEGRVEPIGLQKLSLNEGDTVLEIGFGTGRAILALARDVSDSGKVFGIDISTGMISRTCDKLRRAGLTGRVDLAQGNAINLPFPSGCVDAIFMCFTLELFNAEEIIKVLSECLRVLRDGGVTSVVSLAKKDNPGLPARIYEWSHKKFPTIIDCRPIYPNLLMSIAGFWVKDTTEISMWGIPVRIVLAEKR